jgi:putative ABC transport system permease protein
MDVRPPKWADRLMAWYCNPALLEEIQGDAHELYFERMKKEGKTTADWKYVWDVIRFCRWSNIRRSSEDEFKPGYLGILWNLNFKIALRNVFRNKLVFSVKMLGLSLCLAFAFMVSAFVIHEFRFDNYHKEPEEIFRIGSEVGIAGAITKYAVSPVALADGIEQEIPEVEEAIRIMYHGRPVLTIEDKTFNTDVALRANSDLLKVFHFDFIRGDKNALDDPNKIVLTESMAYKLFGDVDPMQQTIDLPYTQLEVTAVIKDVPANSHLKFGALISWDTYDIGDTWDNLNAYTYVKLKSGSSLDDFLPKIRTLFQEHQSEIEGERQFESGDNIKVLPIVENIMGIHLAGYLDEDIADKRSKTNVYILVIVGILFFVTGLINFVNLSLAEQTTNLRKIGILQVYGGASADNGKLILTNLLLTFFIILPLTTLLIFGSLMLAESHFSISINKDVFLSSRFLLIGLGFITAFIFSTKINSFILSRSNDIINALKGKINSRQNGFQLREMLVASQLSFSIIMIAIIVIIVEQFQFVNSMDKGFEDKNTIVVKMRSGDFSSGEVFQESVRKLAGIKTVDGSSFYFDNIETKELFEVETAAGRKKMLVSYMNCGYDFINGLNIQLVEGRNFSREHGTDKQGAYLINETAAKEFGWKKAVGKRIWGPMGTDRSEGEVIGIVKDFNFESLHSKIEPLIIFPVAEGWGIEYIYIKTNPIRPANLISEIEKEYKKSYDGLPFEWEYLDAKYHSLYKEDYEIKDVFQIGLVISIFVSCLGIFSISALLVIMRAKEMGIRKVIGANPIQLFGLHMKSFVKFIMIAVAIAWPVIYFLSRHWLSDFAYHIDLNVWYFVFPAIATFLIVLIISGYHGVKNSRVNPVEILKHE